MEDYYYKGGIPSDHRNWARRYNNKVNTLIMCKKHESGANLYSSDSVESIKYSFLSFVPLFYKNVKKGNIVIIFSFLSFTSMLAAIVCIIKRVNYVLVPINQINSEVFKGKIFPDYPEINNLFKNRHRSTMKNKLLIAINPLVKKLYFSSIGKHIVSRAIAVGAFSKYEVEEIVLAVGYKARVIMKHFSDERLFRDSIKYSIENKPLGTGGAIKKALETFNNESDVLIVNGDSFFPVDLNILKEHYHQQRADVSIGLKYLKNRQRFGSVVLDGPRIIDFNSENLDDSGLINGGIYLTRSDLLSDLTSNLKFSFEDYISDQKDTLNVTGLEFEEYFFDLGVPADYQLLKNKSLEKYLC